MRAFCLSLLLALLPGATTAAQEAEQPVLPRIVLIGDSIRLGYAPTVEDHLAGKATIISPAANGGDSSHVLRNLDAWVVSQRPDVVHFNCGIHDTKKTKSTGTFQVSPEQYEKNLREIVTRIRQATGATVLFATTTPLLDARAAQTRAGRDYELLAASVETYNQIASKVMRELQVPVNDLHAMCGGAEQRRGLIGSDGVHFTAEGKRKLGEAVAEFLAGYLKPISRAES